MQISHPFASILRVTARWMLALFLTSIVLFQIRLFFFEETNSNFQAQTAALHPIFEGWYSNGDGATCSLDFGYKNDNAVTVSVPIGGNNFFRPSPQNQGQPTKFLPGRQRHVFRIIVPANYSGNKLWTLAYAGSRETCTALLNPALKIEPITVNAGPDQTITLPAAAQLQGTYTDACSRRDPCHHLEHGKWTGNSFFSSDGCSGNFRELLISWRLRPSIDRCPWANRSQ